ncbi:response regulator [Dokdonia pacifica]|uniref:response regulator n=1 Tax=Dokdonia pacifica TaxID=1627892 RepID=UPI0015C5FF8C|nr:response regulator [Dokdonia pacifica]
MQKRRKIDAIRSIAKFILLSLIISISSIDDIHSQIDKRAFQKKEILTHLEIAKKLQKRTPDSSRYHANRAINLSIKQGNDSLLAASYLRSAYIEYFQANDSKALNIIDKIDSLSNKQEGLESIIIDTKIYRSQISKFTLTLEGVMNAKDYLMEGIELSKKLSDSSKHYEMKYHLGSWHAFIAQEVSPKKHKDSAEVLFFDALKYFQKNQDNWWIAEIYSGLALMTDKKKYPKLKTNYHQKWIKAIKKTTDTTKIAETYYLIASADRKGGDPYRGLSYIDSAQTIYEKIGYPNESQKKNLLRDIAYLHADIGNYKEAYTKMQKALVQSQKVYIEKNTKNSMELEAKYQTEKKEQEIALLQAQNEAVEAQKKNQRNLLLGGLGLTSIAGIFLFLGFRNRKKTNDKLRELDTMKSSFFENISHEFRTPLSLIAGPIEKQLRKPDIDTSEKKNLSIAKRNTKRLLTLVDQLLDLSKVEAGHFKLNVQQGDLGLFLRSLTSSFSYLAQENNQEYTTAIDIPENTYYFDADALEKIITNLISNALKYSPDGESITITSAIENQKLQFTIQNSGATLSEEALQTIFNRFARTDEQTAGTGIGLALSKELVTLHKGTIHAQSAHDTTIFTITIPVTESAFTDSEKTSGVMEISAFAKAETTTSKEEIVQEEVDIFSKDTNPILLIVDDNADLRTYVSSLFEDQYTIHTAQDGQEGFEVASSIVPDLIITDLMMPKDDGITLTRNCKASETTSHIPIVMLTAKAGDENQLIGLETGADAYITKPFNTEILKTTTHNLLETRKRLQERFSQEVVLIPKDIAVNSADERFLDNLKEIVDTQIIESDFTTESFSKALGMSRMQLHRKLKALTGLSATEFIRSQRLKLAAQLLKKSDINVSQVGYAVGFNNHSYFTKCFKEHYGVSPSDYAKKA